MSSNKLLEHGTNFLNQPGSGYTLAGMAAGAIPGVGMLVPTVASVGFESLGANACADASINAFIADKHIAAAFNKRFGIDIQALLADKDKFEEYVQQVFLENNDPDLVNALQAVKDAKVANEATSSTVGQGAGFALAGMLATGPISGMAYLIGGDMAARSWCSSVLEKNNPIDIINVYQAYTEYKNVGGVEEAGLTKLMLMLKYNQGIVETVDGNHVRRTTIADYAEGKLAKLTGSEEPVRLESALQEYLKMRTGQEYDTKMVQAVFELFKDEALSRDLAMAVGVKIPLDGDVAQIVTKRIQQGRMTMADAVIGDVYGEVLSQVQMEQQIAQAGKTLRSHQKAAGEISTVQTASKPDKNSHVLTGYSKI